MGGQSFEANGLIVPSPAAAQAPTDDTFFRAQESQRATNRDRDAGLAIEGAEVESQERVAENAEHAENAARSEVDAFGDDIAGNEAADPNLGAVLDRSNTSKARADVDAATESSGNLVDLEKRQVGADGFVEAGARDVTEQEADEIEMEAGAFAQEADTTAPEVSALVQEADVIEREAGALVQEADVIEREAGALVQEADTTAPEVGAEVAPLVEAEVTTVSPDAEIGVETVLIVVGTVLAVGGLLMLLLLWFARRRTDPLVS